MLQLKLNITTLHDAEPEESEPGSYLPARSDLDVDGGLTIPEDSDIFLWEVNHCEVSSRPDEHFLISVNHAGRILQGKVSVSQKHSQVFSFQSRHHA